MEWRAGDRGVAGRSNLHRTVDATVVPRSRTMDNRMSTRASVSSEAEAEAVHQVPSCIGEAMSRAPSESRGRESLALDMDSADTIDKAPIDHHWL